MKSKKPKKKGCFTLLLVIIIISGIVFFSYDHYRDYTNMKNEILDLYRIGMIKTYSNTNNVINNLDIALVSNYSTRISNELFNASEELAKQYYHVFKDFPPVKKNYIGSIGLKDFIYNTGKSIENIGLEVREKRVLEGESREKLEYYREELVYLNNEVKSFLRDSNKASREEYYKFFSSLNEYYYDRYFDVTEANTVYEQSYEDEKILEIYESLNEKVLENPEEYLEIAAEFLYERKNTNNLIASGGGPGFVTISTAIKDLGEGPDYSVSINIIDKTIREYYVICNRTFKAPYTYFADDAVRIASEFLNRLDLVNVQLKSINEHNGKYKLVFHETVDNVIIYPGEITVEIARDNGEILEMYRGQRTKKDLGMAVEEVEFPHQIVSLDDNNINISMEHKIPLNQARERINPNNKILTVGELAILKEGILCWRFKVENNDKEYWIFINAENGQEVAILRN